jgi:hypothetical protein
MVINEHTYLCRTSNRQPPLIFDDQLRSKHFFVLGDVASKAWLLVYDNLLRQDIMRGGGVTLVDFTGDLSPRILNAIPPERVKDTVYADFGDRTYIPGLNVLPQVDRDSRPLLARQLSDLLKGIWGEGIRDLSDWIAYNTIRTHLEVPGALLPGLTKIFVHDDYRAMVLAQVKDPFILDFWHDEFDKWTPNYRIEAISPIRNKLGQLINDPYIRNPLCATHRNLDFNEVIKSGKILIANLNSRANGRKTAQLLGSIFLALHHIADQESTIAGGRRHHLYVTNIDEYPPALFDRLITDSKHVSATVETTHTGRLDPEILDTLLTQIGALAAFNVNATDAELLRRTFGAPEATAFVGWTPEDFYVRLPTYSAPLSVAMLKPNDCRKLGLGTPRYFRQRSIINNSRDQFMNPRVRIERAVSRWRKQWA